MYHRSQEVTPDSSEISNLVVRERCVDSSIDPVAPHRRCRNAIMLRGDDMAEWDDRALNHMAAGGDPAADIAVSALVGVGDVRRVVELLDALLLNDGIAAIALPPELADFVAGSSQLPAWADPERIKRAQWFFQLWGVQIATCLGCSTFPAIYASPRIAKATAIAEPAHASEAAHLIGLMRRRLRATSDDGRGLVGELMGLLQLAAPRFGDVDVFPTVMRQLIGEDLAAQLQIPEGVPAVWKLSPRLKRLSTHVETHVARRRVIERIAEPVGRDLLTGLVDEAGSAIGGPIVV